MGDVQEGAFGQRRALGHCVRCLSRLIYTADTVGSDAEVILLRRCPECELRETVVVSAIEAVVRYRHDSCTLVALATLADSLREDSEATAGRDRQAGRRSAVRSRSRRSLIAGITKSAGTIGSQKLNRR
jgi:hypothetical protein